jgi:hypothetical protein
MWNGPVKSGQCGACGALLGAVEQEGLGFLQTEQSKGVLPARGQERQLLRLSPQVEEATG